MSHTNSLAALRRSLCHRHRLTTSICPQYSTNNYENPTSFQSNFLLRIYSSFTGKRWMTTNAEWAAQSELGGLSAYDILGVSQGSSFAEIKASFRKLAKETHPDLAHAHNPSSDASKKFIQILTAYEILSDSNKRAHYDRHLFSHRTFTSRKPSRDTTVNTYSFYRNKSHVQQMEVVEWLKWYRYTINDILSERRVTAGSGYFDVLERDFYSAVHAAFYGPEIGTVNLLPDCFEAEERSVDITSEVLHLVSGRDLFGMVCIADNRIELSKSYYEKLTSSASVLVQSDDDLSGKFHSDAAKGNNVKKHCLSNNCQSDAYKDLELHLSGRVIAMARRLPPKHNKATEDAEDQIYVYLTSGDDSLQARQVLPEDMSKDSSSGCRSALGVIKGLGTSPDEGQCYVYNNTGSKTHVIMKHRTMLVKHLHWYRVGEKVSVCECRGTRACLPPSKFWLFEPRCAMHDIGGWYVETFGRDKKGKTIPAQRYWDGLDTNKLFEERLNPAMYLFALAYRTLDIEDARRVKKSIKDRVEARISKMYSWYKKV